MSYFRPLYTSFHTTRSLVSLLLVVVTCLVVTLLASFVSYHVVYSQKEHYFQTLANEKTELMRKRFRLYEQAVLGGVGFFSGSENVTFDEWQAYAKSIRLDDYLGGGNGLGFIEVVSGKNIEIFERQQRKEIGGAFAIHPSSDSNEKYVVKFIEPVALNQRNLGLDIAFEERRKQAADAARDSGMLTLTRKVNLIQGKRKEAGFLLLAPVYKAGTDISDEAARREGIRGWVYSPFMASKFIKNISDETDSEFSITVYDSAKKTAENNIFKLKDSLEEDYSSSIQAETILALAGQTWTIEWRPRAVLISGNMYKVPLLVFVFGLLLTVMFAYLFYLMSRLNSKSTQEKQHAEEALLQEKTMLELAEKTAGLGHWHYDKAKEEIFWSDEVYKIHGVSKKFYTPEIESAIDFFHKEDKERVKQLVDKAFASNQGFTFEARLVRPNKSVVDVLSIGMPIEDENNEVTAIFGVLQDISAQKKSHRDRGKLIAKLEKHTNQLKESEQFLQLVMDHNPDFIFVKDEDFRIVQANKAFINIHTKEMRSKVIGSTLAEPYCEEESELFFRMDRKAFQHGYVRYNETITIYNGDKISLDTQKIRFQDSNNKRYILGLCKDVTEQEKLNLLKDEFISTVNHELRTPLTSISMALDLLSLKHKNNLDDKAARMLELSQKNCGRLMLLINDILDIEKIAAGKMEYHFEVVEMNTLLADIVEQNAGYAEKHDVCFVFHKAPHDIFSYVDRHRLHQVMANLLSNAAKFSYENQTVTVVLEQRSARRLVISVEDKGKGIAEEFQTKMFEKFAQASHSDGGKYAGTGLGLAITKSIVEAFKGNVKFDSKEGEGTTFFVTLPSCKADKKH